MLNIYTASCVGEICLRLKNKMFEDKVRNLNHRPGIENCHQSFR